MRRVVLCVLTVALLPVTARAQGTGIQLPPSWDKLASRAKESVKVNLDRNLLGLASRFLSSEDADQAEARRLIAPLRGITVRSLEFDKPGEYTEADLDPIRAQLSGWSRIVETASRVDGESVDIFVKTEKDQVTGLVVLAREPKELTFVHIDGPIDPAEVSRLGGHFGIPRGVGKISSPAPSGKAGTVR
jgi:hypothetical protein